MYVCIQACTYICIYLRTYLPACLNVCLYVCLSLYLPFSLFVFSEIDCGDPPDIANSKKSVDGTSVNSTSNYSCDVGYISIDNSTMTSVCEVTGRWTSLNFTCFGECGCRYRIASNKRRLQYMPSL